MATVTFTGFSTIREARAFAQGMEHVNDSAIEVIEVMPTYVMTTDREQEDDLEINLSNILRTGA